MSDYIETIKKSMRQTKDCQAMANQAIKMCYKLVDYVKLLEKENEELKKERRDEKNQYQYFKA